MHEKKEKACFLILSYGGPRRFDEVEDFLTRIFGKTPSPEILEANKRKYAAIGGSSPVCSDVERFAEELEKRLSDFTVKAGFRFSKPYAQDVIVNLFEKGIRDFFLFPLAPFYSEWSFKGYLEPIKIAVTKTPVITSSFKVAMNYSSEPEFLELWKKLVKIELENFEPDFVIFTAHSLPLSDRAAKTVYRSQFQIFSESLAEALGLKKFTTAFQSKGRRGEEWLTPDLKEVLEKIGERKKVLVVPVGFIQENMETLYDLDIDAKNFAETLGLEFRRVKTPIVLPEFADFTASLLEKKHVWETVNWESLGSN